MAFAPKLLSITASEAKFAGVLAYACPIPGTVLCFLVLIAYAVTACFPEARPHLDRVTFRLLTYAMVFNVLYGIAFSVTAAQTGPGPLCAFGAFAVNFTLSFSTFFMACIALNLQLVLVHSVNGKMMEKYYVMGTTLLTLVLTVPAYGLGELGWQADNSTCWFKSTDLDVRLDWLIGSQSFWILFMATIETICSTVVLCYLVGYEIKLKALRSTSQSTFSTKASSSAGTKRQWAKQYRNIIIRIALYPIVSLLINYLSSILDIYTTIRGINTQLDFRLLVLDLCVYGIRTAAYGLLALGDPSFLRAIRAIRDCRSKGPHSNTLQSWFLSFVGTGTDTNGNMTTTPGRLAVSIELGRVAQVECSPTDTCGHEDSAYHPHDKRGNKSVTDPSCNGSHTVSSTGVVDITEDAVRRTGTRLDSEEEIARNFRRQL